MAIRLQGLDQQVPIVDDRGIPTQYFIRYIQDRNGGLTEVEALVIALELLVNGVAAVDIIAGVALSGGGNIGAGLPITIDHDDSAVTPDTYGDATNVAQITVDAQGHVTEVVNVPISGGGGGGSAIGAQRYWKLADCGNGTGGGNTAIADINFRPTPGGADWTASTAWALTAYSGYPAVDVIDNNPATRWADNGIAGLAWITIDLGTPRLVEEIEIVSWTGGFDSQMIREFTLWASNDDSVYYCVGRYQLPAWPGSGSSSVVVAVPVNWNGA